MKHCWHFAYLLLPVAYVRDASRSLSSSVSSTRGARSRHTEQPERPLYLIPVTSSTFFAFFLLFSRIKKTKKNTCNLKPFTVFTLFVEGDQVCRKKNKTNPSEAILNTSHRRIPFTFTTSPQTHQWHIQGVDEESAVEKNPTFHTFGCQNPVCKSGPFLPASFHVAVNLWPAVSSVAVNVNRVEFPSSSSRVPLRLTDESGHFHVCSVGRTSLPC